MYPMCKRCLDVFFALLGLALCLPGLLVVSGLLWLEGERKPLFTQERVGRNGRLFILYKLRTLKCAKGCSSQTLPLTANNDPSVSRFCRFLRRKKIDELPQFFNVLRGDLSFVGPRPLLPEIFYGYPIAVQKNLIRLRPGLTGLGSLAFRNESRLLQDIPKTEQLHFYHKNISPRKGALEQWYVHNQNLWIDFKILLLTPYVLCFPDFKWPERWFGVQPPIIRKYADKKIKPPKRIRNKYYQEY